MPEHVFRWSIRFAIVRTLFSFAFWGIIFLLPGLMFWMASLDKPGGEVRSLAIYLGLVSLCGLIHARRYWMRLFHRDPQLEFHPGFLRARQFGDVDLLWKNVTWMRGLTKAIGRDVIDASIYLTIAGRGEVELDTTGLDADTETIFRLAETMWQARRSGP